MSLPLFVEDIVPQFVNGKWTFNNKSKMFEFNSISNYQAPDFEVEAPKLKFGIQFQNSVNQIDEMVFRQQFSRPQTSLDSDVIVLQDIKNVVLFLAPMHSISKQFVEFFHQETCDKFLNALIIYFEYFVKVMEFLMIRRDEELQSDAPKVHNMESVRVDQIFSAYLSQYRLLLAREYCRLILGEEDLERFHHCHNRQHTSITNRDRKFFETLLNVCPRIVWIALHRRAYTTIDYEITRLFRSSHFNVVEKQIPNCPTFSLREQQILYGINNKLTNCRGQKSPLVLEILNVSPKNVNVLWIGLNKYDGNDPRMHELEMEYATPDSQLSFADIQHGILGHPKMLYDTMLQLNRYAVRQQKYNDDYDPYRLYRHPVLRLPSWKEFKTEYDCPKALFKFECSQKYDVNMRNHMKRIWKNKETVLNRKSVAIKGSMDSRRAREMSSIMMTAIEAVAFENDFKSQTSGADENK